MRKTLTASFVATAALLALVPAGAEAATGPSDKQIAAEGILTIDDFPADWEDTGPGDSSISKVAACNTIRKAVDANKKYRVESHDFESSSGSASNAVFVLPSTSKAKTLYKAYADGRNCLRDSARKDVKGATITISALNLDQFVKESGVDEAVGFQVDIETEDVVAVGTVVVTRIGRVIDGFSFLAEDDELAEGPDLAFASIERLLDVL